MAQIETLVKRSYAAHGMIAWAPSTFSLDKHFGSLI